MFGEHFFWITSRAAGVVALLAATAAVALGLMMGGKLRRGPDLRPLHEALALSSLVALAIHALSLLGDSYMKPSVTDLLVPFVWSYDRVGMTIGIFAGWALAILGLSYYVRGRIGPNRWRMLHRFTALAWLLGIVHTFMTGTDAGTAWFILGVGSLIVPTFALLVRRMTPERTAVPA